MSIIIIIIVVSMYGILCSTFRIKRLHIPHEDLGKSVATAQVLQRKHETFERDVAALGNKVAAEMSLTTFQNGPSHTWYISFACKML